MKNLNLKMKGFSVVELLVTVVLNALVILAITQLYTQNRSSFEAQDETTRMLENGRFAMEFITRDIRYADFWGCMPDPTAINNQVTAAFGGDFDADGDVDGLSGTNGTGPSATDAGFPANADTITISGASSRAGIIAEPGLSDTADTITVNFDPGLAAGDMATISDCVQGDVFVVTGITANDTDGDLADDEWVIAHDQDISGTQVNESNLLSKDYKPELMASLYAGTSSVTYSIGNDNGKPALMRAINGNSQVLITNVETLQILYGEDTDGDASADRYVPADEGTLDFGNVTSLKISLLVRSDDETNENPIGYTMLGFNGNSPITPTDNRSRKVYSSTIAIRNRAETTVLPILDPNA